MTGKHCVVVSLIFFMPLVFMACATREKVPLPVQVEPGPVVTLVAMAEWEKQWTDIVAGAKREGRVTVWGVGASWAAARESVIKGFKNKYGIEVEFITLGPAQQLERIFAERKAGIYNIDINFTGPTTGYLVYRPANIFEPLEPALILPEVRNPKTWLGGKLNWLDPEHTLLGMGVSIQPKFAFNSSLVRYEEIRSLNDLLNAKWKGKIVMDDPSRPGPGNMGIKGIGTGRYGWDFLRELMKQEPLILADYRQQTEWLAQGKYHIALFISPGIVADFSKAGAPVQMMVPDDSFMSAAGTYMSLMKDAPHPKAARLFINWMLTREGQSIYVAPSQTASARLDVPNKDLLNPAIAPDPAVKYRNVDDPDWIQKDTEYQKMLVEIFLPFLRR